MLIAFVHAWDGPHVKYFLETVQGHELWQITDEKTPELPGCNVFRVPRGTEGFVLWRARAYAAFNRPGAYLDTDLIVQRDLSPIMALDFDVALAKTWVIVRDPKGTNLTEIMPYNGGVVFVKHPEFWPHVVEQIEAMPEKHQNWYGDQFALAELAKQYYTLELPNKLYNYTPKIHEYESGADLSDKWILHFKGGRKDWMKKYGNELLRA